MYYGTGDQKSNKMGVTQSTVHANAYGCPTYPAFKKTMSTYNQAISKKSNASKEQG